MKLSHDQAIRHTSRHAQEIEMQRGQKPLPPTIEKRVEARRAMIDGYIARGVDRETAEAMLARIEMEAQVHAFYLEYREQEGIPEEDRQRVRHPGEARSR